MIYKATKATGFKANQVFHPDQGKINDHLSIFDQLSKNFLTRWKMGVILVLSFSFSILLMLLLSSPLNAQKASQVHPEKVNHLPSEKENQVQKKNINQKKNSKSHFCPNQFNYSHPGNFPNQLEHLP